MSVSRFRRLKLLSRPHLLARVPILDVLLRSSKKDGQLWSPASVVSSICKSPFSLLRCSPHFIKGTVLTHPVYHVSVLARRILKTITPKRITLLYSFASSLGDFQVRSILIASHIL